MICNKCGHHSEGDYGVCPFCGQPVVNKKDNNNTKLIVLLISLCGTLFVSLVIFGVILATSGGNSLVSNTPQSYTQEYVAPELSAEPLPDVNVNYKSEQLPQVNANYKSEPIPQPENSLKKEPIKSAPVKQEATTSAKAEKNVATKTEKAKAVFSNGIGEINGKTYAIRCVGKHLEADCYCGAGGAYGGLGVDNSGKTIIPALPDNLKNDSLAFGSFCYYDGYVYYTVAVAGTGPIDRSLYRCKSDFTGVECIAEWKFNYDGENDYDKEIYKDFVIYDNILYMNKKGYSADLATKKVAMREYPDFTEYTGKNDENQVYMCGDKVFVCYNEGNSITMFENGKSKELVSGLNDSFGIDGGYVNGYLYYSEYVGEGKAELRKMNVSTGKTETISETMVGGGFGPYFCF